MDNIKLTAPCIFGIESIAAGEFRRMGFEKIETKNGRVDLYGGPEMLARANICSRFAERIYINMGEFSATSFTEVNVAGSGMVSFNCPKALICLNMKLAEPNSGATGVATI